MPASSRSDSGMIVSSAWTDISSMVEPAPPMVPLATPLQAVAKIMKDDQANGVIVVEQGQVLGLLSPGGLIKALALTANITSPIPLMVLTTVPTVSIDTDPAGVAQLFQATGTSWLPVVDDLGKVVGVVTQQRLEACWQIQSQLSAPKNQQQLIEILQKSPEIRFQAIFEQINVGICQASLKGRLVDANPGFCQMLGYSREELVTKTFRHITHPADLNLELGKYEELLAGRQSSMFVEKRYIHKDGCAIWVALTVCLVRDAAGKPLFSIGVSQDISDRKAAELALKTSHQHITDILESITDAFFALDPRWRFTYLNRRAEQFLQQPRQALLGQNLWDKFPEMLGTLFSSQFRQAMGQRQSIRFEEFFKLTSSWYEVHIYPTQEGLAVYFQDITHRKEAYQQIEHQIRREQALNRVIQAIRQSLNLDHIFETAAREIASLLQANQVAIQHFNPQQRCWTVVAEHRISDEVVSLLNLVVPDGETAIASRLKRLELVKLDATKRWAEMKGILPGRWLLVPLHTHGSLPWGCLGIRRAGDYGPWQASEIDLVKTVANQLAIAIQQAQTLEQAQRELEERQRAEARLVHDARHDSLTGIPNRTFFMEQLNAAVKAAKKHPEMVFSVLFIDLDRFKVVNDSLGHLVGDQLLIECADRLTSVVRDGDLVARLGGDEFAVLLDQTDTTDDALTAAQRIHEVLQVPMVLEGREIFISASIGISSNWTGSIEAVDFLRDADTAMYQAKNSGRGCSALFDPEMYEQISTQLTLETDLQRVLQRQELSLHFQPIIDLVEGRLVGFEALARWQHPRWGNIPPSSFIPLAEETGLILGIGDWTQRMACQQLRLWQRAYPQTADLTMSINLSVKQFGSPNLITTIDDTVAATGLSYRHLHLEITESALIDNPQSAEFILRALRERGVQLGIDDFGTGYSSLNMVHQFPVQVLKIDRSFTHRMAVDHRGVAMVQSILGLANNLGMTAIAEGVETQAQLDQLRILNCPLAQGYYFSKPLPADEAEQFIKAWPGSFPHDY